MRGGENNDQSVKKTCETKEKSIFMRGGENNGKNSKKAHKGNKKYKVRQRWMQIIFDQNS